MVVDRDFKRSIAAAVGAEEKARGYGTFSQHRFSGLRIQNWLEDLAVAGEAGRPLQRTAGLMVGDANGAVFFFNHVDRPADTDSTGKLDCVDAAFGISLFQMP